MSRFANTGGTDSGASSIDENGESISKSIRGNRQRCNAKRYQVATRVEKSVENNITKESLLWFQSLKQHWLNSPRTPIQPILPLPPTTKCKEAPVSSTLTVSSYNNTQGENSNIEMAETSISKKDEVITNATPTLTNYRERLIKFYEQYNPTKLNTVDTILAKYCHKEEELFQILHDRYCRYLPIPCNSTNHHRTIVFLEFEYKDNQIPHNQQQKQKRGMIQIQLFQDVTPYAAENFRCLCTGEKGVNQNNTNLCYINTFMHRIVPNMCIQGGDITTGDGTGGRSIYTPSLRSHPKTDLWGNFVDEAFVTHSEPGLLSMANNGPDRNNSQFFITVRPLPHLNGKHVVFGKVICGMDVVYDIAKHTITDPKTQRQLPDYMVKIVNCGEIKENTDEFPVAASCIRASDSCEHGNENCPNNHRATENSTITSLPEPSNVPEHKDLPTSHTSFRSAASTSSDAACHVESVSSDCIMVDGCDCNDTTKASILSEVAESLDIQSFEGNRCIAHHRQLEESLPPTETSTSNTVDTALVLPDTVPNSDATLVSRSNISKVTVNSTNNTSMPNPIELLAEVETAEQKLLPNDSMLISHSTQPTSRLALESIVDRETLSPTIIRSSDIQSKGDVVRRESNAPNTVKSSICQSSDNTAESDKTVASCAPSTTLSQCHSKNDESTVTALNTSYCCDTSYCGSVLTSASSASEQVELLHQMIDEAQIKLRSTRKKLEERINLLKSREPSVNLECDNIAGIICADPNRNATTSSHLPITSTVPSEVNLKTIATISTTHNEHIPINSQYFPSLLKVSRDRNNLDGKINVTLPNLPADVGIPLLLMSK